MYKGVTVLRPHPLCHCDGSSLASPSFYCFISVPWRMSGEAPALGSCTCFPLSWWKTMRKKCVFSHCLFYFIIVCDSQTSGLGADWGVGETSASWHWELFHSVSMADVPPRSSWFLCHNCSHGLHRVGINIRHVNVISTDSLARREMLIINSWSWHIWQEA